MPDLNQLTVSSGSSIVSSIDGRKTKISSIDLLCELANNVQYLEVGKKTLVKFIVKGLRGDPKNVNFEVNPNGIFELTTTKWKEIKAKTLMGENWRLQTYITAKKEGEANIQVIVDGKKLNTIKLTTKVQADKDVFGAEDVRRLHDEFMQIKPYADIYSDESIPNNMLPVEYRQNYCVFAASRALGKLLNNSKDFWVYDDNTNKVINYVKLVNGTSIGNELDKKSFVKSFFEYKGHIKVTQKMKEYVNDSANSKTKFQKYAYEVVKITEGSSIFNEYIKMEIHNKLGFHVFFMSITGDFHVLILLIDYRYPCGAKYIVYDQHGVSTSNGDLKDIDEGIRRQVSWTFLNDFIIKGGSDINKYGPTNVKLWKMQKK